MELKDPSKKLKALHDSEHPQARFVWAILRDSFHYSAVHLADIADTARQLDLAMKWGFGHAQGPFELWQSAGWHQIANWITQDINAGRTLSSVRSEEHTSELQSLMRISYAVFCLKNKNNQQSIMI